MPREERYISPWVWVATLYFAEGVPYFIVNNVSVTMFTQWGVGNGAMALFTSLLYLPWTVKPLWSPFVDVMRSKRWWIVAMQGAVAAALVLLALTLPQTAIAGTGAQTPISLFSLTLVLFVITAFASATHDIAADGFYMLALNSHQQASCVGLRSVFYRLSNIFCNSLLVFVAGWLEGRGMPVPAAWRLTLLAVGLLFTALALWHAFLLPRRTVGKSVVETEKTRSVKEILLDCGRTFGTFFRKQHIGVAVAFMLLFRLPEAFLLKMVTPFMLGDVSGGGLGLTLGEYSVISGMAGVIALLLGGVLGGLYAARKGLRGSLWLMALSLTLPDVVYLLLSIFPPENVLWTGLAVALEQFGYGFGFTAYMLYLMYFSAGEWQTSHYALCTAFMALGMMLPGMVAGYLQEYLGYTAFFAVVMLCCIVTLCLTAWVCPTVSAAYGRKDDIEKKSI